MGSICRNEANFAGRSIGPRLQPAASNHATPRGSGTCAGKRAGLRLGGGARSVDQVAEAARENAPDVVRGHRASEQKTLGQVAAEAAQRRELAVGLDSLGDR